MFKKKKKNKKKLAFVETPFKPRVEWTVEEDEGEYQMIILDSTLLQCIKHLFFPQWS